MGHWKLTIATKVTTAIVTFVCNCYMVPVRLFVLGGTEGNTREDPTVMAVYGIASAPLLKQLVTC